MLITEKVEVNMFKLVFNFEIINISYLTKKNIKHTWLKKKMCDYNKKKRKRSQAHLQD